MKKRLILGCGYLGRRVARRWVAAGDRVIAITRTPEKAGALAAEGIEAVIDDLRQPAGELLGWTKGGLEGLETVLVAVGFDRSSGASIGEVYTSAVRTGLSLSPPQLGRFLYVSTTGVYGDAGGDWIDEATPPAPVRPGAVASLAAEQVLLSSPLGDRGVALRLAGIYGPGRVPFLDLLRAGEPIPAVEEGWLNLIHVEDAAEIVVVTADAPGRFPPVLCVSDGNPPRRGDYYQEVARLVGAPTPRFTSPEPDSPRAARAASDKRVRNTLMLSQLGVELRYPSYREGLASILAAEGPA